MELNSGISKSNNKCKITHEMRTVITNARAYVVLARCAPLPLVASWWLSSVVQDNSYLKVGRSNSTGEYIYSHMSKLRVKLSRATNILLLSFYDQGYAFKRTLLWLNDFTVFYRDCLIYLHEVTRVKVITWRAKGFNGRNVSSI